MLEIFKFKIPFIKPIKFKSHLLSQREGLILKITDPLGHIGLGEASPLPGFSKETLDDVIEESSNINDSFLLSCLGKYPSDIDPEFKSNSLKWAICSAFLAIHLQKSKSPRKSHTQFYKLATSFDELVKPTVTPSKTHMKLSLTNEESKNSKKEVLKIKVSRDSIKNEAEAFNKISETYPHLDFILDANKGWELNEALLFFSKIDKNRIKYIEDPLKDPSLLENFYNMSQIPYAADEYLSDPDFFKSKPQGCKAAIVKPTLTGSISDILKIKNSLPDPECDLVFSSSFESNIGIFNIALLNYFHSESNSDISIIDCGIDTFKYFKSNTMQLDVGDGKINVSHSLLRSYKLNHEFLESIQ